MVDIPGSLHGARTRAQAVSALGVHGVRAALRAGELVALWPRVLVDAARRLDPVTRSAAALLTLGPGAVLAGLA
ncbi:MAG TPA: hypothetical protein VGD67_27930, partial [Pseudonocardiaceae bacterium]